MTALINYYLASIKTRLRLDNPSEQEIIRELETHIEDELRELRENGLSEEEAAKTCLKLLGSAKLVARRIYEAHSQGTWSQALLASLPHLLFALIFTMNWWHLTIWLAILPFLILGIAIYGWCHGRPIWLSSWLSYSLVPIVIAGLSLLYLPQGWSWLAILLYLPLALWLVLSITIQTIKRDWLYCALMLLPAPIIAGWFVAVEQKSQLLILNLDHISHFAPWIGLSFLTLAITAAAFIRLRQHWLRVVLLLTSGLLTLAMVARYTEGRLEQPIFLLLTLVMLGLLLSPALVESVLRHHKQQLTA